MASENQIKHKIVISGEQEYKRAMREMSSQLKEAKSEVRATAAEMDAQGKSVETLTARMQALENQREKESDMLREMRRHLEEVVNATGAESEEAVRLRTRINAMRTEIAQTNRQISELTGELDEARDAAEGLGGSGAADGIRSLGDAAQGAEGDLDGILGKLAGLGAGFTIGIGAELGKGAMALVKKGISDAIVDGWNDAVQGRIEYNQLGVKTGTAGTGQNLYMQELLGRLKLTNPNRDTGEWIDAIAAAYTQLPEEMFQNGERMNKLLKNLDAVGFAIGMDVPTAVNTIGQLKDVFGESPEDLTDVLFFLGTSQAGNEGIEVLTSYATSWSSIGMNAIQAAGALVLARIAGVDNLTAVGKAANEAQAFILENKKGLKALGVEAEDLPNKFRAGGEEAKEAMRLLLQSFLNADPDKQNELGPQIFGQQGWERYGTRIAEAILQGYDTTLTPGMHEKTEAAAEAMTNDLPTQFAITDELKTQILGEMFAPWEDVLLQAVTMANQKGIEARENGKKGGLAVIGEWVGGFFEGVQAGKEEHAAELGALGADAEYGFDPEDFWASWNVGAASLEDGAEEAGEEAADAVMDAYASGFARNPRMRALDEMELPPIGSAPPAAVDNFLDALLGTSGSDAVAPEVEEAAEEKGEEAADAVMDAYASGFARNPRMRALDEMELPPIGSAPPAAVDNFLDALLGTGGADAVAPEVEKAAGEKGEEAADAVMDAYASGFARNPRMRALDEMELPPIGSAQPAAVDNYLDLLLGTGGVDAIAEAAEEKGEGDGAAALDAWTQGAGEGMDFDAVKATVENLNAQIAAALNAGDTDLAEELTKKRNALIPVLMQLSADAKNTAEDAKEGFDAFKGIEVTIEDTATGAVTKFESGIQPLVPAGQRSVDGLIGVLNGAADPAYTAGWNAGDAFNRGYRDAQGIRSPSRVMQEAAEYSMAGLMAGLENGGSDLERRAAGLSDLLAAGASGAGASAGALTLAGADGADAAALREALTGLVLMMDGEIVGALTERSVSQEGARRAAGTVRGRANGVRSW